MKTTVSIIFSGFLLGIGLLILFFLLTSLKQGYFTLGPYMLYPVSDCNLYKPGDPGNLLVVRFSGVDAFSPGDFIAFNDPEDENGIIVTRSIVEVIETEGEIFYITDKDYLEGVEPYAVSEVFVLGKAVCSIPVLGYILYFLKSKTGMALLIIISGMIIAHKMSGKLGLKVSAVNKSKP